MKYFYCNRSFKTSTTLAFCMSLDSTQRKISKVKVVVDEELLKMKKDMKVNYLLF